MSIMVTTRQKEGLFQKYFRFFKNGQKKMSKIEIPFYLLEKSCLETKMHIFAIFIQSINGFIIYVYKLAYFSVTSLS